MKKRTLIALFSLIIILLSAFGVIAQKYISKEYKDFFSAASDVNKESDKKNVVAIIGDKKIYQENIDMVKATEALSSKNEQEYAQKHGLAIPKKEESTDEDILKDLIRDNVIYQQAKKEGLLPDYDETYALAEQNYRVTMELNNETTEFIKKYMEELGMSEKEYIEQSTEANIFLIAKNNLYQSFLSKKNGTDAELKEMFEKYVDELTEKTAIEYK